MAKGSHTRKKTLPPAARAQAARGEDDSRKAEAWRLRVKEGRSYPDIARAMGVATATAHRWCKAVRDEVREESADLIDSVTTEAIEQLRRTIAIAAEEYENGRDPRHATALVAAQKRLADLVGADAPKRVAVTGEIDTRVMLIPATMTAEEWEREHGEPV